MPGIQMRLSLLGVLPTGLLGLVLVAYFTQVRTADLDQHFTTRCDLAIRQLAMASASHMASGEHAILQNLANSFAKENDVIKVEIFDSQGKTLATQTNASEKIFQIKDDWFLQTADIKSPASLSGGERLGSVSLVLSKRNTFRQQRNTLLSGLAMLLAGMMSAAWIARRMGRAISEPVRAVALAIHEMSRGNMDVRIEPMAKGEMAYLQAGFNAMAAELKKNRDSLERQVQEATLRLQKTLTALEKRNGELETARGMADAQTELKSRFLAQMSHEIRTPMNGILGFAELLAKSPLDEGQVEKLGLISRSAKNLLTISNEILDLSKLEAGKICLDFKRFQLRPTLEDIVSLLCVQHRKTPVILWIHQNVPKTIENDPVRLQQVIANLLGNAIKFIQHGRIVIRVRTLLRKGRERLFFSVSDSGCGISPKDIAKLFSPFQQLGQLAVSAENGAGLGLSIAKNIVQSMGGEIHIASRLGKGTSLWFDLPLDWLDQQNQKTPPQLLVGLIEPDRLTRQALCQQLESLGARVMAFADQHALTMWYEKVANALEFSPSPHGNAVELSTLKYKIVGRQPFAAETNRMPSRHRDADLLLNSTALSPHGGGLECIAYGITSISEPGNIPLAESLEWCNQRQIKPILLLQSGNRHHVRYYRKRCISSFERPVGSETLGKALGLLDQRDISINPTELQQKLPRIKAGRLMRFLVADDNEINRLLLRAQLENFRAEIIDACDGNEALEKIRQEPFDIIFLDLQMPYLDGQTVLKKCRECLGPNQHIPVIAITAFCDQEQREAIIRNGFSDCLIKPVTHQQMINRVRKALASKEFNVTTSATEVTSDSYVQAIIEKTGGNLGLARVIANKLFTELPECMNNAATALAALDRKTARLSVHKINGSASFSGLAGIRQIAASLESALCKNAHIEILENLFDNLKQEVDLFISLKNEILDIIDSTKTDSVL